jgi:stage V sporulation protein R
MILSMEKRFDEIEDLAHKKGLDFFPVIFEEVPREIIWDVASYGLPTRMSHWSFGRTYIHQRIRGEMGFSKIFELVINNNPAYAFLDETNSDVVNLLIAAHVLGHSDFFKNNVFFGSSNRNMVNQAEQNAKTIDKYKETYGIDEVEEWMDIAFSIDMHIDISLGEVRSPYPPTSHFFKTLEPLPFSDLFGENDKPNVVEKIMNENFPPHPERDLLWFLINYGQMLPWQKDILNIIRSESYYFYPQGQTKIMNEGWASYWHAELMLEYDNISPEEYLDFSKSHSGVVNSGPPGQLNPYYLGFRIFSDIKKRWDKAYEDGKKDKSFQKSDTVDMYDDNGKLVASKKTGTAKMFEVRKEDGDFSFITNYLTTELADDMKLFSYGFAGDSENSDEDDIILKNRSLERIKNLITAGLHNNGAPPICILGVNNNELWIHHEDYDVDPLEKRYTEETLKYISKAWGGPVKMSTHDDSGPLVFLIDKGKSVEEKTKKIHFDI